MEKPSIIKEQAAWKKTSIDYKLTNQAAWKQPSLDYELTLKPKTSRCRLQVNESSRMETAKPRLQTNFAANEKQFGVAYKLTNQSAWKTSKPRLQANFEGNHHQPTHNILRSLSKSALAVLMFATSRAKLAAAPEATPCAATSALSALWRWSHAR